jgi:KaiC/GvpD/RAD55 family RecA-like ATPase
MNIASFLEHWGISENPFHAEEARHDPVFARLDERQTAHPDFEKIVGDLASPSSSIVFGEKGSGKTAIRIQLADRIRRHNASAPDRSVFLIPYDDLNPILDRFAARAGLRTGSPTPEVVKAFSKLRLVDHIDAILQTSVTKLTDEILGQSVSASDDHDRMLDPQRITALRKADAETKRQMLLLAALHDRSPSAVDRVRKLKRTLRASADWPKRWWTLAAWFGWIPTVLVIAAALQLDPDREYLNWWMYALGATIGLWLVLILKRYAWDRLKLSRTAKKLHRQIRTCARDHESIAAALDLVPNVASDSARLPLSGQDDERYALMNSLLRVLGAMEFTGAIVLVDRMDEPTLISGDPQRMRPVVWPLLNNKFLQMPRIGVKALLPLELRHELFRESSAFFQEARLDKQSLVERLTWTGSMLYDLCSARLNACRVDGDGTMSLVDLFATDVSRQDLVDALDQMHQPRDAFKLMYQCISEHCQNTTRDQASDDADAGYRIPRLTLETVRKQQSERVQMFYRGIRPA